MHNNNSHKKRFQKTLDFLDRHIDLQMSVLDLGIENPLSELMKAKGYKVKNTKGEAVSYTHLTLPTNREV